MVAPVIDSLANQVTATVGVMESATVFINGTADRIQAAVDKAIANGATEAELAPVQDEVNLMRDKTDTLAAAIAANQPPSP